MESEREVLFYKKVGQAIRNFRLQSALNQTVLASKLGLSRTSIVNIEHGRQHPSLYQLWLIAESLNVSLAELIPKDNELHIQSNFTTKLSEVSSQKVFGFIEDVKNNIISDDSKTTKKH